MLLNNVFDLVMEEGVDMLEFRDFLNLHNRENALNSFDSLIFAFELKDVACVKIQHNVELISDIEVDIDYISFILKNGDTLNNFDTYTHKSIMSVLFDDYDDIFGEPCDE